MSTVRKIIGVLTSVIERKRDRRLERVQCRPSGEQMEPRALLSGLKVGVATLIPPQGAGGALVIRANQAPSFNVSYQSNQAGAASGTAPTGVVEVAAAVSVVGPRAFDAALNVGAVDVDDHPADDWDGIQNHSSVGDDVVDQGNVENKDPSGP